MRNTALLAALLFPFVVLAQYEYTFKTPPSPKSKLLQLGQHTVLIEPMDLIDQNQKWLTFDSMLNIVAAKKLVTPGAVNLIQQTYLEGKSSVIRIDQFYDKQNLVLSAFVFDVKGNLLHSNEVLAKTGGNSAIMAAPFSIAQSPDRESFALIQSQQSKDSLTVAAIVFDDTLGISSNAIFTVPYNAEMYDVYAPFISDEETLFLAVADKFDSYKLSADVKLFSLIKGSQSPLANEIGFDRKKIKNLHFSPVKDSLFITALFSSSNENKEEVAGALQNSFVLSRHQNITVHEHLFSDEIKKQLKRTFGGENRKGNLLNYISILPGAFAQNGGFNHAVLLPYQSTAKPHPSKKGAPANGDRVVVKKVIYTTSYVVSHPPGYPGFNSILPANLQGTGNLFPVRSTPVNGTTITSKQLPYPGGRPAIPISKNLLYYSFNADAGEKDHKFIRLKPVSDAKFSFFTYYKNSGGYGVLHYIQPAIKQPYLNSIFINNNGAVEERKIIEDKNRIILAGYDFVVTETSLLAFYEDKITGSVGLIKLEL